MGSARSGTKGTTNNPNGRTPGTQNKATIQFKEALNNLLDVASPEMVKWLGEIEDPFKRFEVLSKFAEYIYPKLARSEQQFLDQNGKPADASVRVRFD